MFNLKLQAAATVVVGGLIILAAVHLGNVEGTSWRSDGLGALGGMVAVTGLSVLISTNRKDHQ